MFTKLDMGVDIAYRVLKLEGVFKRTPFLQVYSATPIHGLNVHNCVHCTCLKLVLTY